MCSRKRSFFFVRLIKTTPIGGVYFLTLSLSVSLIAASREQFKIVAPVGTLSLAFGLSQHNTFRDLFAFDEVNKMQSNFRLLISGRASRWGNFFFSCQIFQLPVVQSNNSFSIHQHHKLICSQIIST